MKHSGYEKFRLVMWKNWKSMIRNPVLTLVDILVPVAFTCLLIILRWVGPMEHSKQKTTFTTYDPVISSSDNKSEEFTRLWRRPGDGIAWAPQTGSPTPFVEGCKAIMEGVFGAQGMKVIQKDDPTQLQKYLQSPGVTDMAGGEKVLGGVVFDGRGAGLCSKSLEVTIRLPGDLRSVKDFKPENSWHTKSTMPTVITAAPRDPSEQTGPVPNYHDEGFLTIQTGISKGVVGACQKSGVRPSKPEGFESTHDPGTLQAALNPTVKMQRFSSTRYDSDPLLEYARFIVPFLIMLSFIYTCLSITKVVTYEKETQMKELMKIMGLQSSLHWIAWYVRCMIILLISSALIVMILKIPFTEGNAVFNLTDGTVIYVFYIFYMIALCSFCFMISSFFTQSHLASVVSGLVWFLVYCPHFFMVSATTVYPLSVKIPLSIFLNVDMAFTIELFLISETTGKGVNWKNICVPANYSEKLTVCHLFMMMILDAVIYMLICLYVEAVCPGKYGVPEPWSYFFSKEHWLSRPECLALAKPVDIPDEGESEVDPGNFEPDPPLKAGVDIQHLWKIFGNKVSVRDLNLKMYEGQITVLLGHNGAGKTTTMSILTGIYTPSKGTAVVGGCDVVTDIEGARQSLGLCPQYNVLFDELTVREHLYFFCKLKGLEDEQLEGEITRFVVMLELEDKENAKSKTLSGGMKRKLNAGVALCGHSKVVLLDEPTSGMDPAARRAVWDVLLMEKEGRTMLLSTHFMDEADVLGDRIAIMAAGQLECCGSSFFLKNKFGSGYRLIIDKGPKCDSDKVSDLLSKHIPGTEPSQEIGSELNYQLNRDDVGKFEPMLKELEQNSDDLDIESYGLSQTTMEEVFISTGKDKESEGRIRKDSAIKYKKDPQLVTGRKLANYRIQAEFRKKWWVWTRNWPVFFLHCLFPIIFLAITLLVRFSDDADINQHRMPIDLNNYAKRGIIVVTSDSAEGDGSADGAGTRMMYTLYKQTVTEDSGTLDDVGFVPNPDKKFDQEVMKKMEHDPIKTRTENMAGASWTTGNPPTVIAWYCDLPYHGAPLTLSLVYNAVLGAFNAKLRVVNHPLDVSENTKGIVKAAWSQSSRVAPMLAFAMAFCAAYYVQFVVRERVVKNKHLQIVSGVDVWVFWLVHYTFDGLTFLLPFLCAIFTLACFQEKGYDTADALGRLFLILIVFGWGVLPLMYCSSYLFDVPATGYTRMAMFNIFTGTAAFLIILVFRKMRMAEKEVDVFEWIIWFFPLYCLAHAVYKNYINLINKEICDEFSKYCNMDTPNPCCPDKCPDKGCLEFTDNYFQVGLPGIGANLIVLACEGAFFFALLLLIDYHVFAAIRDACAKRSKEDEDPEDEDPDVQDEKKKIRESDLKELSHEYALVLRDVTKYYGSFRAVNHTCVAIPKGQCFGLLGTNGAGKTTTFKMMTGDIKLTRGEIYIDGLNAVTDKKKVQQRMGYCPQFDAILQELTGWETMKLFCLLKGIPKNEIKSTSEMGAKHLMITKHMDKKTGKYSGGNRRKLSTAVALIGNPVVVFLDEPTTGMDPMARRHLWNVICGVRDSGVSVILTSHSMEECEALCTRVAIQVNGNFKCLGSLQHLKTKYAKGFTLQIKVGIPKTNFVDQKETVNAYKKSLAPVKKFVTDNFKGAKLQDQYMGVVSYSIKGGNNTWSEMFGMMEKNKKKLKIEDYAIGQSSLEAVFLRFTKEQKEDMNA